jgi:hypothetical protein
VLPTVSFDDQSAFDAGEVGNAPPNGFLSLELESAQAAVAKTVPKTPLSVG